MSYKDSCGWLLAIIVPMVVMYYLTGTSLGWASQHFIIVFSAALCMWVFQLVPEYVPIIFLLVSCLLLGIAPQDVILSGFTSNAFFIILSLFSLGAVIIKSGLAYRLALLMIHHLPSRLAMLQSMLLLIGFILSMFINVQINRIQLMMPLFEHFRSLVHKNKEATYSLLIFTYVGAIYFSELFLTGKTTNYIVYGLFPSTTQLQFTWLYWFIAALFPVGLMFLMFFFWVKRRHTTKLALDINKDDIQNEIHRLGKVNFLEYLSLLGILMMAVGIYLSAKEVVELPWVAFGVFYSFLALGALNREEFKTSINWPFLFYIAGVIGVVHVFLYLHLDNLLLTLVKHFASELTISVYLSVTIFFFISFLATLIFGTISTIVLLFPILLTFALHVHFNPWVLAFIVLNASECWLFSYQSTYQLFFECYTEDMEPLGQKSIPYLNYRFSLMRYLAIMLSVPYWKYLGLL